MPGRVLLLALTLSGAVLGQQSGSQDRPEPPGATATRGPQSPQWRSLSVEDKLSYDARHLVEFDNFVYAGIGAALDQARSRRPECGQGGETFAERYGSHVAQYLVQRSIMFPVQAMDGEAANS